jgi:Peptidase family M50
MRLPAGGIGDALVFQLGWANLVVGIFNLLPGRPLDGGRMLRPASSTPRLPSASLLGRPDRQEDRHRSDRDHRARADNQSRAGLRRARAFSLTSRAPSC